MIKSDYFVKTFSYISNINYVLIKLVICLLHNEGLLLKLAEKLS